jgi:hypothetical protein
MRPDQSGVIMMTDQLQWEGQYIIMAVATGHRIPIRTFHWLSSLAHLTSRQLAAVEFNKEAEGFNGEFNLRTIGTDSFRQAMVMYFSQKGFVGAIVEHQGVEIN